MAKKQDTSASVTESVAMDTRKFLSAINSSAQAQIAFFSEAISRLGEEYGRDWRLAALHTNRVFFEDVENHEYFVADHGREKGGRVKISNIKRIQLHEDKKPELFENSCLALVEAIEKGDVREMDATFNKVAASRFRSTAIPSTGIVKTRDGVVRQVAVEDSSGQNLANRIIECLTDRITINEDGSADASFVVDAFKDVKRLGVTELTTRKLVAHYMQETALSAYKSGNFQTLVEGVAGLVCEDSLEKAITVAGKFLVEHQEFCLLTPEQWERLIEDTLATKACFNEELAHDVATLMRKTNLKVNRDELIDAWRKTAERAQHPVMLENVDTLAEAENFEEAYGEFLPTILEAGGETAKGALIAGLEMLKQKVSAGDVDQPTAEELDAIIQDLKTKGDSASTWKAMETLDGVRRGIENLKGMDDFDSMPGPLEAEQDIPGEDELGDAAPGETTISGGGDKPLEITVKMDPAKIAASAQPAAEPAAEPAGEGFDLSSLDDMDLEGNAEGEEAGGENEGGVGGEDDETDLDSLLSAGKEPTGEAISEEVKSFLKAEFPDAQVESGVVVEAAEPAKVEQTNADADTDANAEDEDAYTLPEGIEFDGEIDGDYKTVIHEEMGDFSDTDVAEFNTDSKIENDKDPEALQAAAEAWIRDKHADRVEGINDPKLQQDAVVDLAGKLLAKRQAAQQQGVPGAEGKEPEAEAIEENQFKSPLRQLARRGLKKASINKVVKEGNLRWLDRNETGVLGEFRGVKFILDHSEQPVALLSEDGQIQIDIPVKYVAGAMFLAEASEEEAAADDFVQWLDTTIESLNRASDEAVDEAIEKVAEGAEPSGEVAEEGKLPPALEKFKFKKKGDGEQKDKGETEPKSEKPEEKPEAKPSEEKPSEEKSEEKKE